MHGAGRKWGEASMRPPDRGAAIPSRLLARAVALMGELSTCLVALGAQIEAPARASLPEAALSTKAAAERLGIAPYTLNDLARTGRIPSRQDTPGGPRHFRPTDLDAYEAASIATGIPRRYSAGDDISRSQSAPPPPRAHTARARDGAPDHPDDGRPLGARRARRRSVSSTRPYAPGAAAWRPPGAKDPEG